MFAHDPDQEPSPSGSRNPDHENRGQKLEHSSRGSKRRQIRVNQQHMDSPDVLSIRRKGKHDWKMNLMNQEKENQLEIFYYETVMKFLIGENGLYRSGGRRVFKRFC